MRIKLFLQDCVEPGSVICIDGTCVPNDQVCDTTQDCPDGADELADCRIN